MIMNLFRLNLFKKYLNFSGVLFVLQKYIYYHFVRVESKGHNVMKRTHSSFWWIPNAR